MSGQTKLSWRAVNIYLLWHKGPSGRAPPCDASRALRTRPAGCVAVAARGRSGAAGAARRGKALPRAGIPDQRRAGIAPAVVLAAPVTADSEGTQLQDTSHQPTQTR